MNQPKVEKFRGYELINPAFTNASVALLQRLGLADTLARGNNLAPERATGYMIEPRYPQAALEWLQIQGCLRENGQGLSPTERGQALFQRAPEIKELVDIYGIIKNVVKWETGIGKNGEGKDIDLGGELSAHSDKQAVRDAMVVPAISYLHEISKRVDIKAGDKSSEGHIFTISDLCAGQISMNRMHFIAALESVGALEQVVLGEFTVGERGKKMLKLGGYAELALSYYDMLEDMEPLTKGEETYGLDGTVNRDAELNAHASNGIINVRVAPHLVKSLNQNEVLAEALQGGGAYIDYGSGGADMLMQVAEKGPEAVRNLYGIDINPRTNEAAQKLLSKKSLMDRIKLVTGSITDAASLKEVRDRMQADGLENGVASINFILHDVGPKLSSDFLRAHATTFPDMPLVVTETLRMPMNVCIAHPNYQAASFQFMHDASGQHLYTEQELMALLEENGFQIMSKHKHSSMPNADRSDRLSTIVSWITKPAR